MDTYMLQYGFLTLVVSDTVNAGLCALKFVALQLDVAMQKFEFILPGSIDKLALFIFTFLVDFIILEE